MYNVNMLLEMYVFCINFVCVHVCVFVCVTWNVYTYYRYP